MSKIKLLRNVEWIFFLLLLFLSGCSILKPVTIREEVITTYRDSTVFHDSTVFISIPVEVYRDYADMLDTLRLETTLAEAKAYLDTTDKKLKGEIKNSSDSIKYVIKWKERVQTKDSLVFKEVPIPYEVEKRVTPKWCWYCLVFSVLCVAGIAIKIYITFFVK